MSRLTELLRQAHKADAQLGVDLESEISALLKRRTFGLVFERHQPEAVELAQRVPRRGDKVRILPPRGTVKAGDPRLWWIERIERVEEGRVGHLTQIGPDEPETASVDVEDLVVVAEFNDPLFPGLVETGRVERGGNKPFHTVINAENFHALQMLTYTHRGKIDAIYIDPPYNTGAKDWKYNNNYVGDDDVYRHSKWLAMMERRLKVARELLNPDDSVLVVTIDEKEYLRLGLLLEQTFPEADTQMVSTVINPSGSSRAGRFGRADEYIFFLFFGSARVKPWVTDMLRHVDRTKARGVRWNGLIRNGAGSNRSRIPSLFYPIHFNKSDGSFHSVGEPLDREARKEEYVPPEGTVARFPVDGAGQELMWRLHPPSLREYLRKGYAKFGKRSSDGTRSPMYLQRGMIEKIESGDIVVVGRDPEGSLQLEYAEGASTYAPLTTWNMVSHSAAEHGSAIIKAMLPGRRFPFPKSLYAVEDTLRFFVKDKPNAMVLDFFAGSGTTAHAVMRLNKQDGGRRQSISVTNNEVSAEEQKKLYKRGLRPNDPAWEDLGICDYVTKPRIRAAVSGKTPEGAPIKGDYKFTDEFPMSDGFEENAVFFSLTYEGPLSVRHHRAFGHIASLLWLRAGSQGSIITELKDRGWEVSETYGVLKDLDNAEAFVAEVKKAENLRIVFIVTDDETAFQMVCRDLPQEVEKVRLYESYLQNFTINTGRSL